MKSIILLPLATLTFGFLYTQTTGEFRKYTPAGNFLVQVGDTTDFDQEKALKMLREEIESMEDKPSSEVWQNIKVMKDVPAGRLLRIMEMGFSKSLGVNCTHCHNSNNFADEDKPQKQITREMMKMTGKINNELLSKIKNLQSDKPVVNCTTCHRGEVKPALNFNNKK